MQVTVARAIEFPLHNHLTLLNQSETSGFGYKIIARSSSPFSRGISEVLGDTLACPPSGRRVAGGSGPGPVPLNVSFGVI